MDTPKFEKSCKTIALKLSNIFISALPGKIVFGEVNAEGFINLKYFIFTHFQLFDFYVALLNIIKFISSHEIKDDKGLILHPNEDQVYFWIGKIAIKENIENKLIVIGIEYDSNVVFELQLDSFQLNELIKCFCDSIFSCLCLKSIERDFFKFVTNQNTSTIVSLKNKKMLKTLLSNFETANEDKIGDILKNNLCELTNYYYELLIISQKMKSLYNDEVNLENEKRRIATLLE